MDSIFEVKSINKNGFELYNLVNEKTYQVKSQIKMVNYRRVFKGSFLSCSLNVVDGEYFLSNTHKVMSSLEALNAYKIAVSMQMEKPSLLYDDNEEKLKEIKENVVLLGEKYKEFFKTEEVYTTKEKLNNILDLFNAYIDAGEKADYEEFIENQESAEVVVMFDPETGLQTVPKDKKDSFDKENFSVPTILYSSKSFEKLIELSEKPLEDKKVKIGRNDPCLCGSGKKYKKCCLK